MEKIYSRRESFGLSKEGPLQVQDPRITQHTEAGQSLLNSCFECLLFFIQVMLDHPAVDDEDHIFTNIGGQVSDSFQVVGDPDEVESSFY